MASTNGIFTYLEHIDSKKDSLRRAILTLAVEWKDLDEHLDSTKDCFNSCITDLEFKQKDLEDNQESVANSSKELDEVRKSLDLRLEEFERREERFRCFQQAQVEELDKKEKKLGETRVWVEEKLGVCEMREENLFVQKKSMEMLLQKIEKEKEAFEVIRKSVGENLKEIHLKERNYESLWKEVGSVQDRMEIWAKELGSKEEQVNLLQKLNEDRRNKLDTIERECELRKERLSEERMSMEVKLENFEMEKEEFEESKKLVDEKLNEIASKERNCESLFTDVNLIQDWTVTRSRELDSKEKEFTLREEQLNNRQKSNDNHKEELDVIARENMFREKKLEMEKKELQKSKNLVDKKWNEIRLKKKTYEDRGDQIEKRARELDLREEQVVVREEQLQAMQKVNKECREELYALEKDCKLKEESLSIEKKSLKNEKEQFEGFKKSVTDKLNEINSLEDRSKELNSIQNWIERRAKELDLGEEQFALREDKLSIEKKWMEVILEKIEKGKEEIEDSKKSISEKLNEISLREINYENLSKEVKLMLDEIESRATELDWREKQAALREEQIKEKLNRESCKKVDIIAPECQSKKEKLNMERKSIKVLFETIEKERKQFENIKRYVGGKMTEMSAKEKNCERLAKEVNLIIGQIEKQAREFGSKDEQFVLREEQSMGMKKLNKERCEDLIVLVQECKFIEEKINVTNKSMDVLLEVIEKEKKIDDITQDCNLKDEMHSLANTSFEILLEKVKKLKNELEEIQNCVGKKLNEISFKERNYENLSKDVNFILNLTERRAVKPDSEVEKLSSSKEQLKPMPIYNEEHNQELDSAKRLRSTHDDNFDSKQQQLNTAQKKINSFSADQKFFEERYKELGSKEKLLEERLKDFESRVKQFEERSKAIESKEKQFDEPIMNLPKEMEDLATLDGRGLQLYVSKHYKNRKCSHNKIREILKLSSDPAKLVLEAMEGFYPPHLKKGEFEFETDVVQRSCVLLLEQLMMINSQIGAHVREAALRLAGEWKVKIEVQKDQLEILGFVQLLASYKLASEFDADQILHHFEIFAMRRLAPELFRALDLSEKVPDLITSLIGKNKHWVAVRFIVEFGLVGRFPPVPLLKDYFQITKKLIKDRRLKDQNTAEAKNFAMNERKACLRNILNCIKFHKLECGKWHFRLECMLNSLKKLKNRRLTNSTSGVKNTMQKNDDNNFVPHNPIHTPHMMSKKVFSYLLADMDGNNLLLFLNKHISEHGHLCKEVFMALQMSSDPAKICLDAIQVFFRTSHLMKGDNNMKESVAGSCILLLELMRISPTISPQVGNLARDIAVDWKSIIVKQTSAVLTLGFLLFVGAFGLISIFDSDEIHKLYQTIGKTEQIPELQRAIGLSENFPVSNKLDKSVPEDLQMSNTKTVDFGSSSHSSWDGIPDIVRYSSDPAQLVLDAVEGCYYSMLTNRNISKVDVLKSFNYLLSRLMRVPLEIKPRIKDQAMKFAADWREKLKRHDSFEVGCLLLLLATYKVFSSLSTDELVSLMEIAYEDGMRYSLFQSLRLSSEVPDIIRELVETKQHLSAVKFSYAFGIVDKFPPLPLLEDYINVIKEEAGKIRERGQDTLNAQEIAIKLELSAFKAVINCVKLHSLDSHHKFQSLEALIEQMEIQAFDLNKLNKKRKRSKGFSHDHQASPAFEPHLSRKQQRAALYAKRMKPNCSDPNFYSFPVAPPPYVVPPTVDYCSGASNSVYPHINQFGPGGVPNGGYPSFGFW